MAEENTSFSQYVLSMYVLWNSAEEAGGKTNQDGFGEFYFVSVGFE